jgi:hypothetical protein
METLPQQRPDDAAQCLQLDRGHPVEGAQRMLSLHAGRTGTTRAVANGKELLQFATLVCARHKLLCLPPVLLLPSDSPAELCGVYAAIGAAGRVEL